MDNYSQAEDILENPGELLFRIDNKKNSFVLGKRKLLAEKDIYDIKANIRNVFQTISEEMEKYKNVNPEYFGHIINNLNIGYGNKNNFNFPGLQVINMDREKLNYFTHYPDRFLLCEKSDGVRYLLVQYKNGKCHLIGRNLEFFEIVYSEKLPPPYAGITLFNNWSIEYLLDGELILDDVDENSDDKANIIKVQGKNKKINFLIFDAVVLKGSNIGFCPFKKRLEELSKVFLGEYGIQKYVKSRGKMFIDKYKLELKHSFIKIDKLRKSFETAVHSPTGKVISLYIKDYYTFNKVEKLNEMIKLLPHHNDGLIINVDDYPYYSGQSCEIFKWKPLDMNTIDFEIEYNENINRYILYITTKEGNVPVEILCFGSDEEKKNFEKDFKKNKLNIGECFYDSELNNDEAIINNYNYTLSKIKTDNNEDIRSLFNSFSNKIPKDREKYKGGWRFQRFRNDKLSSNFITTYQNIKICIKENVHMDEIIQTLNKNKGIKLNDLKEENNLMCALIWKKFFKKKQKDNDEDELFFDDGNDLGNYGTKNELLNKKRKKSDDMKNENENDDNNENNKDDEDNYDDDIDKICDDDDDLD